MGFDSFSDPKGSRRHRGRFWRGRVGKKYIEEKKTHTTTLCVLNLESGLVPKLVASYLYRNKPEPGAGPVPPLWPCRRARSILPVMQSHVLQPSPVNCPVQTDEAWSRTFLPLDSTGSHVGGSRHFPIIQPQNSPFKPPLAQRPVGITGDTPC